MTNKVDETFSNDLADEYVKSIDEEININLNRSNKLLEKWLLENHKQLPDVEKTIDQSTSVKTIDQSTSLETIDQSTSVEKTTDQLIELEEQKLSESPQKQYYKYININNIAKTIAVYKNSLPYREELLEQHIPYMNNLWNNKPTKETYQITFALCIEFINELVKFPAFALTLKKAYDDAIIKYKYTQFIKMYNTTFKDDLYSQILFDIDEPLALNDVDVQKLTIAYNQSIKKRHKFTKKVYTFNDNEIVGARDKQGSWWHARILKRLIYKDQNVYYVEFSHWGEEFNEWISDTRRIMKYNPKRHILYRPAWVYNSNK